MKKRSFLTLTIAVLLLVAQQSQSAGRLPVPKTDTLTALQQTLPYNDKLPKTFPDFTYQNANDKPLVHLREKYKLDSVAGNGTDVERVIRLLAWFHKQVPHGDVRNLPVLNAENIIDTYRTKIPAGLLWFIHRHERDITEHGLFVKNGDLFFEQIP